MRQALFISGVAFMGNAQFHHVTVKPYAEEYLSDLFDYVSDHEDRERTVKGLQALAGFKLIQSGQALESTANSMLNRYHEIAAQTASLQDQRQLVGARLAIRNLLPIIESSIQAVANGKEADWTIPEKL